jgi:DNA-binding MarR family transcriptional regulator
MATPQARAADCAASIRRSLLRHQRAAECQRLALASGLELCATDALALQHLAERQPLSPGELAQLLRLSSGGSSILVARLQRAGCAVRETHPTDRRRVLVRLSPDIQTRLAEITAPLDNRIAELTAGLTDSDRPTVERFINNVAHAAERHADELTQIASAERAAASAIIAPGLWA